MELGHCGNREEEWVFGVSRERRRDGERKEKKKTGEMDRECEFEREKRRGMKEREEKTR